MHLNSLKIIEQPLLANLTADVAAEKIEKDGFIVSLDGAFPRIISYELDEKKLTVQDDQLHTVRLNGEYLTPIVSVNRIDASAIEYTLTFDEQDVIMKMLYSAEENNVLTMKVTDIQENSDYRVRTFGLGDNAIGYTHSRLPDATYAFAKSNGEWHGISEELVDDMELMERSETSSASMAMISGNGLAVGVENNVMSGGNKVELEKQRIRYVANKATLYNGTWTYRSSSSEETEELPWFKVVVTEDLNDDGIADWQDGAVAYREYIMTKAYGSEDMANNMMYIPFNFASQANDSFLNSLDTGKILYNYTDGFGQMLLHKGYQAEGHDDDIPAYSNVGVRQGGSEDMKTLIELGSQYNIKIGVHLNATEYHLDAAELYYDNLNGATSSGYKSDSLSGGWDWIDTSYYVNQSKDVLSGELEKRLTDLYELTKTENAAMDFYYIDVYTGNDYNAYKMTEYINQLGLKAGTEFAGPLEPGVTFVHWGTDLGYTNTGNRSELYRMVKSDLDIFCGNALYKGQKIPIVSYWGDSKMDIQQGVTVFYNEVVPTKFMQHFGVLKSQENQITFENGVVSQRTSNGTIELSKDGKRIAVWKDTGTTTADSERHNSETLQMIPWSWDADGDELGLDQGAKLYHWNPEGGTTTWDLTNGYANVSQYTMYELTQQGKVKVDDYTVNNGKLTVTAGQNTPYVLYPSNVDPENIVPNAGDWGEGSAVKDFAFNSESAGSTEDVWQATDNVTIETVSGRIGYQTSKETSQNRWNKYAQIGAGEGMLTQQFDGLEAEQDYTVSVWTNSTNGRKAILEVEIDGEVYTNYVTGIDGTHYSSFKYRNTNWQRLFVKFHVPKGVTGGTIRLIGKAGNGTVQFDDVKVWQHLANEEDPTHADYVAYEDFDNVAEGWGIFEYGASGSLNSHLASYQDNPNNMKEIVKAGLGKQGLVMTWVLDGTTSMKYAERYVGYSMKTSEAGLKLEPNTKYEMSFIYTMEIHTGIQVRVQSRSTGAIVFQRDLVTTLNSGDMENHEKFTAEFTTGNESDYQVVFYQTKAATYLNSSGATVRYATKDYAFILDNFGVREYQTPREKLQILVDSLKDLNEEEYTEDSWADLQRVMKKAEDALADMDTADEVFEALFTELESTIKALVKQVNNTELVKLIEKAEEITPADDYTANSWKAFTAALADAKAAVNGTQDEVNAAYTKLERAMDELVSITKLKEAVAEAAKTERGDYTSASWEAFQNAIDEADKILKNESATTQQVAAALDTLSQAKDNLVKKGDTTALAGLIEDANKLNEADYTEDTWKEFKYALDAAQAAVSANDSSKEELETLYQNLETAIGSLETIQSNVALDELKKLLEAADLLKKEDYSEPYWNLFADAKAAAEELAAANSEDQTAINLAYRTLEAAMNLMLKAHDNSGKAMIDIALATAQTAIEEGYDDEGFLAAYNNVKDLGGKEDVKHTDIVDGVLELMGQMKDMGYITGGQLDLQDLYDISRLILLDCYEDDTEKTAFADALETAGKLLHSASSESSAVKEAYRNLFNAAAALNPQKAGIVIDKSLLDAAIELAKVIEENLGAYTTAGQEAFMKALRHAQEIFVSEAATQEDIDTALETLIKTMDGLKKKADKTKLDECIKQALGLDLSKYTDESAAYLKKILALAQEVMADDSLSADNQITVNEMVKLLEKALNGLVEKDGGNGRGNEKGGSGKTGDAFPLTIVVTFLLSAALSGYLFFRKKRYNK